MQTDFRVEAEAAIRPEYKELSELAKAKVAEIKGLGVDLLTIFMEVGQSRELSLAQTKLEEAIMWAVKHLTK